MIPRTLTPLLLSLVLAAGACGRKADPQPYALVQPKPVSSLSGEITDDGVRLAWTRPRDTMGGKRMDDLGGFLVYRGRPGEQAEEIADVAVEDRVRFQREKKFEYLDRDAGRGETFYYRVIAYTTDRYYSEPSNQVTVEIAP